MPRDPFDVWVDDFVRAGLEAVRPQIEADALKMTLAVLRRAPAWLRESGRNEGDLLAGEIEAMLARVDGLGL